MSSVVRAHDHGSPACDECLRRTWLLGRLAGHLDPVRDRIDDLLGLDDARLVAAVAGRHEEAVLADLDRFSAAAQRDRCAGAGVEPVCRCDPAYPERLRELPAPPAVLHVIGGSDRLAELLAEPAVAVVGTRRPSSYGRSEADVLGRTVGSTGLTVISGMALGIDSAAHRGALQGGAATVAVLPAGADRPYPATARALYRRIAERGLLVSELGPGSDVRRWMFTARNRIIAALSAITVVVQARERSGALVTARWARDLGRHVGAVPGDVGSPLSVGPHALLRDGAELIAGAQDVLDVLFGAGERLVPGPRRAPLEPPLAALLDALAAGETASEAFRRTDLDTAAGLSALAALELEGWVRREPGGRVAVVAH
jgi:DNA processing protein